MNPSNDFFRPVALKCSVLANPLTVTPNTPVREAIAMMGGIHTADKSDVHLEARASCVVTVVVQDRVVGIVTERDVVRLSAQQQALALLSVGEVMAQPVITCRESDLTDLFSTIELLKYHHIRHLPIVDEGDHLIGMVTHESLRQQTRPVDLLRLRSVVDVMTSEVLTAGLDCSMLEIARLMDAHRVSSIVITVAGGIAEAPFQRAVGLLTERDLVQFQALGLSLTETTVEAVMSSPVFTVAPDTSLWTVQQIMEQERIRRVIVVGNQGELLGIVTQTSMLKVFNPLELYQLAEILEQKVTHLEKEHISLRERRAEELESHITESNQAMQTQAEIDRLLQGFAMATIHLMTLQEGKESIQAALDALGSALGVDRSYIFEKHPHPETGEIAVSQRWEWVAEGITCQIDNPDLQNVSFIETVPRWYQVLSQGQPIFGLIKDFPEDEQVYLFPQEIVSIMLVPIFIEDYFWGVVGFDDCHQEKIWGKSTQAALKAIASAIGRAIARRRAEAQASSLADRLQEAQRMAHIGNWELDLQQNKLYWSEEIFRIFEIDSQQFSPSRQAFWDLIYPEDRAPADVAYSQHLQDRQPYNLVHRIAMADGRIKYVRERCETTFSTDGIPLVSRGTVQDITPQKEAEISRDRAEIALRQVIEGTAAFTGEEFFPALVRHIAEALGIRYACVSQATPEGFQTLAFFADGKILPPLNLPYESAPCCTQALDRGHCCHPDNIRVLYPDNPLFTDLKVESYLGVGLRNTAGDPIGNLCIFHDSPLANPEWAQTLLPIFAARAGAELERLIMAKALEKLNADLESRVVERTAELEAREVRYRALMNGASDAILLANPEGYLIEVNPQAMELTGYDRHELVGMHMTQLHPPEALSRAVEAFEALSQIERIEILNLEILRRDGQRVPVDINASMIEVGGETIIQGIFHDLRERLQAEEAIKSENTFRQLILENLAEGLCVCHSITDYPFVHFTVWNPQMEVITGYTQVEINQLGWYQTLYPDPSLRAMAIARMEAMRQGENIQSEEWTIQHRDGSNRIVSIVTSLLQTAEGQTKVLGVMQDITERKQVEVSLQQSEKRYAMLAQAAPVAIFRFDLEGHCIYVNERWCEMTGKSPDFAMGDRWLESIHPDDRERSYALFKQWLQSGAVTVFQNEARIMRDDGEIVWYYCQMLLEIDTNGEMLGYVGTLTDISDRKQVELALQESETRFRRVFVSNVVGMMFTDFGGQVTDANDHFLNIIGYSRADLEAHSINWAKITPPEYVESDQWAMEQLRQYGEILPWEKEYLRPDGSRVSVLIGVALLSKTDGRCVCVVLDISDRRRAEATITQQLRQQTALEVILQEIRQSLDLSEILKIATEQLQELLHSDRVIVFQVHHDGRSQIVEETVAPDLPPLKAMHWDDEIWSQEILEHYWQGQPRIIPDVMDDIWTNCLVEYSQAGQIQSKMVAPILQEPQESKFHRWVSPNDNNRLWGVLVVHACHTRRVWHLEESQLLQQVANQLAIAIKQSQLFEQLQTELGERQRAQQKLTQRNQELVRVTRLKDEFLANMSHELRTPLNAVLGMTEGLKEGVFGAVNDRQIDALNTIDRSGSHLLNLINDILDLAKIEAEQMELDLAPTDVVTLCQNSISLIRQQALNKKQQLLVYLPYNLPDVILDERRILQVLINLLNNAVKFTPEGKNITLEVIPPSQDLAPSPDNLYIRFAITDTGIGISEVNLQKLFQPFVQIDSALNRKYQGTGLGLALVKKIVELHGGQISLTSEEGKGSCFSFQLPYLVTDAHLPRKITFAEQLISPELVQPSLSNNSLLLLLVEDNEANIKTVSSYLTSKGYRIVLAKNGLEAIQQAIALTPDLILMDIQMPELDGLEAIKRIRAVPDLASVPIIAVTALAMEGDRQRCLEAGATDYMAKPIKLKELALTITKILG